MPEEKRQTVTRGARTRARLLAAARELLVAGDGELILSEVAARAGVSAGAPYRHFTSKAALVVAVVEEVFDELEAEAYLPSFEQYGTTWWQRECVRIERFVGFFFDTPVFGVVMRGLAADAEVAQARTRRLERQTAGAASNISKGQQTGEIGAHIDPTFAGALIMGGIHQLLATVIAAKTPPSRDRVTEEIKRFVRQTIELEPVSPFGASHYP